MSDPLLTPGRALITLANLLYAVGAFAADFNETHVYNPRWPPHARFHNGQTMTLGVFLSAMSLYFAYRRTSAKSGSPGGAAKESMFYSALIGSFYCAAGMTAILYPGTDWKDPDITVGGAQPALFSGVVVAMWVGYALEVNRLGKAKAA
ncbi:hypothetical protein LTR35_005424 [Friedmanniomyces endolithicus]|uniref:Uncharacterized protein n=1 Tax=Friedmanniomyces endolithicus TaxID=329885 RepID=A0AAN6FC11_9PEZI|nr:hypothetical protein LTR35_005424 [Friedmanniomyces endolithicus]KAK0299373.1 hypothetical protein LTS00_001816 [Friedmanniomyces endolithicus]KAK0310941.1 hypothetical protein LTR82_014544 [Friedmanniomyces endolithicus]KAK0983397.1 hypothetical protein LTR54_014357 [Friedmanniomyces endolithicus]KAK1065252.1 hypothetical protein LTR74_008078 [Friedmanniomyces endolithicus]